MNRTVRAEISAEPDRVFAIVSDLTTYPEWLDLVTHANEAPPTNGDEGQAWMVTIRAKIGPLARSKRLRMVRTSLTDQAVLFERREVDGRDHSRWTMAAAVDEGPAGSNVEISLRYDGSLWSGPLEVVLGSVVERAGPQLSDYASD